jgi:hypothetical protein
MKDRGCVKRQVDSWERTAIRQFTDGPGSARCFGELSRQNGSKSLALRWSL